MKKLPISGLGKKAISAGKEVSKQVKRAHKNARETATKISTAKDKIVNKAKDAIVENVAEGLVEHGVPTSVLIQAEEQAAKKAAREISRKLSLPPKKPLQLPAPVTKLRLPASVASEVVKETPSVLNQDVSVSMAKIHMQNAGKTKDLRDVLFKRVEDLSNIVSHERPGKVLPDNVPVLKRAKVDALTEVFYNKMRATTNDVITISKNTDIPEEIIQRIKSHVFLEDHVFLRYGRRIGKFDIDENIAAVWQRLIDSKYVKSDLILLQHEYAEALKMNGMTVPYEEAHDFVNKLYNWEKSL